MLLNRSDKKEADVQRYTDKDLDIMTAAALYASTVKCLKIQNKKKLNLLAFPSKLLEFEFCNCKNRNYSMKYSENWTFH